MRYVRGTAGEEKGWIIMWRGEEREKKERVAKKRRKRGRKESARESGQIAQTREDDRTDLTSRICAASKRLGEVTVIRESGV